MRRSTAIASLAFSLSLLPTLVAQAQQAPTAPVTGTPPTANTKVPVTGTAKAPATPEPAAAAPTPAAPAPAAPPAAEGAPAAPPAEGAPAAAPAPAPATTPPATAAAVEASTAAAPAETYQLDSHLTLDPASPYLGALPGGTTPSFGEAPVGAGDWRFDFHGVLIAPIRAGINSRLDPSSDKSRTVLHAPPEVPDNYETFSHTGVVANPYVQLNFSYGNSIVTGNVSILARQTSVSTGYFEPASQPGIYDAYINIHPDLGKRVRMRAFVGAFSTRYGTMGEYGLGRYGTPLIARVNGIGEDIEAAIGIDKNFTLVLEQGFQGLSNKAPVDIYPEAWNDQADSRVGTSFASHMHAGITYQGKVTLGGHYIDAFSRDERGTGTLAPDGKIRVVGADLRLRLGRFGHFMAAFAQTTAQDANTVGRVVEVMNTRGGPGLVRGYLGGPQSDGTGKLVIIGAQYDLSIGKLISYPTPFTADGPDLVVSLFGINGKVTESTDSRYSGLGMFKVGGEATYSMLSWLAASVRYDHVEPDVQFPQRTFAVLSPRLIFHTDWSSTDQIVLQYSHWYNGSMVMVQSGSPPRDDVTKVPDTDMVSLSANMWW